MKPLSELRTARRQNQRWKAKHGLTGVNRAELTRAEQRALRERLLKDEDKRIAAHLAATEVKRQEYREKEEARLLAKNKRLAKKNQERRRVERLLREQDAELAQAAVRIIPNCGEHHYGVVYDVLELAFPHDPARADHMRSEMTEEAQYQRWRHDPGPYLEEECLPHEYPEMGRYRSTFPELEQGLR